ncbi:MAG: sensor histidine kinase, partial [bacterium]
TAQENLEKTIEELKRSNVELERFAYVVSHDLKEPLRMVSSYVNLLRKRYREKLDKDADEFIDFAAGGADRMSRLIDDILEYSRVSTRGGEFEKADTGEIVERVLNILKFKIKDSGARIKLEGGFPVILADPRQITQVFQNLIENAIKFSGKDAPVIKISAYRRDDEICFRVSDSGIGIKKEYSRKIFEIFQRLHTADEYEGTGIGLAIVKKIIERHGGEIWVESPGEGLGSVFVFTIPLKK